jgi:hypothetical protein
MVVFRGSCFQMVSTVLGVALKRPESTCSQGQNAFVYPQFILTSHLLGHAGILGRLSGHIESVPRYSTIGVFG